MDWLLRDLRHAVRQLDSRPGYTLAVVAILAFGIGSTTATFSLSHGLLLRPLPYLDSEAVVSVGQVPPTESRASPTLSADQLWRLWEDAESFEQLAAFSPRSVVWQGPDGPTNLLGTVVSPSLFPLLRAAPRLGRVFAEEHTAEGADHVVLLSHRAWANRFGSDQAIIGATVELNHEPYTVLGVLPESFAFPRPEVEFWQPLVVPPAERQVDAGSVFIVRFSTIGRLRPGVSPAEAATEVRTILGREGGVERAMLPRPTRDTHVVPLREERGRPYRSPLLMLGTATGLVLLMACANVAGLFLARGIVRQPELAIRGALGAGRGRIVRQLLTESVVLSIAGGTVGLGVAVCILRALPAVVPRSVPGLVDIGLDWVMLAFAAGLSVATGLLFGAAPSLAWSRIDLAQTLNEGSGSLAVGFGRLRTHVGQAVLTIVQVALALVLLTSAGLLLRSFVALVTFAYGFEPTNVVAASVQSGGFMRMLGTGGRIGPEGLAEMGAANRRSAETLLLGLDRIAKLPGVESVALTMSHPLFPAGLSHPIGVSGRLAPPSDRRDRLAARIRTVSAGYAQVMRLRLRAGRFLTDRDTAGGPRVAVVSEAFARVAFGSEPAVGQRLVPLPGFGHNDAGWSDEGQSDQPLEVVGVVADVMFLDAQSLGRFAGEIYVSALQPGLDRMPAFSTPMVAVRTEGDPGVVVPFLREVLADVGPERMVNVTPLESMLLERAAQPRFYAVCAGIFGGVALLLAVFGLYGLLSYNVSQRRREIGVRMALGAGHGRILMLVVRQGAALVGAGIVLGLLAAAAATRIVESVLFGVTPADPLTFAVVTTVLLAIALLACWLPALRATRIDPVDALRKA